jgi:hypothetical protein
LVLENILSSFPVVVESFLVATYLPVKMHFNIGTSQICVLPSYYRPGRAEKGPDVILFYVKTVDEVALEWLKIWMWEGVDVGDSPKSR